VTDHADDPVFVPPGGTRKPYRCPNCESAEAEMTFLAGKLGAAEAERDRLREALEPFIAYLSRETMIYGFSGKDVQAVRALGASEREEIVVFVVSEREETT